MNTTRFPTIRVSRHCNGVSTGHVVAAVHCQEPPVDFEDVRRGTVYEMVPVASPEAVERATQDLETRYPGDEWSFIEGWCGNGLFIANGHLQQRKEVEHEDTSV